MALQFDGAVSGDYISVDNTTFIDLPNGDWTFGVWIKWDENTTAFDYAFSAGGGFSDNNTYHLEVEASSPGQKLVFAVTDAGGDFISIASSTDMSTFDGVWIHAFAIRSVNTVTLYINNSSVGSGTNANLGTVTSSTDLNIGRRSDGSTVRYFDGGISELFKVHRALNSDERQAVVNAGRASRVVGDLSSGYYYQLDINGADFSGNANNGALNGPPTIVDNPPIGFYVNQDNAGDWIEDTTVVTGTLVGDIGQLLGNISGTFTPLAVTGTLVGDIGQLSGNISGTFTQLVTGTLVGDIGQLSGNISGTFTPLAVTGTLVGDIGQLVGNISGTFISPGVTGTLVGSIGQLNGFFTGTFTPIPQVPGGGGRNARGNIPRKTARGNIEVRKGLASLTAPRRSGGGIF